MNRAFRIVIVTLGLLLLAFPSPLVAESDVKQSVGKTIEVIGSAVAESGATHAKVLADVTLEANQATQAAKQLEEVVQRLSKALKPLSLAESKIEVVHQSIRPRNQKSSLGNAQSTAVLLQAYVRIETSSLEKLPQVIDALSKQEKVRYLENVYVASQHPTAISRAYEDALQDAKLKASLVAKSLGLSLGPAQRTVLNEEPLSQSRRLQQSSPSPTPHNRSQSTRVYAQVTFTITP